MTALRGRQIESFLARPDVTNGVILVYGPDTGKVRETADRLVAHYAGADADPMAVANIHFSEIETDPGLLIAEADSGSLFGSGRRTVRLRGANSAAAPTLEALAGETAAIVVVEAGPLGPSDALRKAMERSPAARALPCYADDERSLTHLIRSTMDEAGIALDAGAEQTLREVLGNDRAVSRSELEKLTLYAERSKRLTSEDVLAVCGDNAALALDQIADAVGTGHPRQFDAAFSRALAAGTDVSGILGAVLTHVATLRSMRAEFDAGTAPDAITRTRRVHFSRAGAVQSQIRSWSDGALARAAARLYDAVATSRKQPDLAIAGARQTLLSLAVAAARM